ncbi:MAG: hypothetical protein HYR79_12335 [Nitrospirae bacterium]|nr:hypothetical protein [Nitrospirota bacterium]
MRNHLIGEYGLSQHWIVDARITAAGELGQRQELDSGRVGTRYGLTGTNLFPFDFAVALELNAEKNEIGENEFFLEPRLIISRYLDTFYWTFNLTDEVSLNTHQSSLTPSMGLNYSLSQNLWGGTELKYNFDMRAGAIIPQVRFPLYKEVFIKTGVSFGLKENHETFWRLALEKEL